MSTALELARTHLAELREELAAASAAGLMDHPGYQADIQAEIAKSIIESDLLLSDGDTIEFPYVTELHLFGKQD